MKNKGLQTLAILVSVALLGLVSGCASTPPAPAPTPAAAPRPSPPPTSAIPQPSSTPKVTAPPIVTPIPPSTPSAAPSTASSITDTVRKVGNSVVFILAERVDHAYFLQPIPRRGGGSGIIVSPDGFIATNNHVVSGASTIKVVLPDGRIFDATLQGADPFTDLAVVKVNAQNLTAATFSDSSKLQIGQAVVAIGNAFHLSGGYTVTQGIVSALGRSIQIADSPILHDLIQTDAAINPGNSGGALVTLDGEVVGINTAMIGGAENIGFAVSCATAEPVISHLVKHGKIIWPWLGIEAITLTPLIASDLGLPIKEGILVMRVYAGGPAAKSGLAEKDIITLLGDSQMKTATGLQSTMRQHRVGEEMQVTFMQGGRTKTSRIVLEQTPEHF